MAPLEPTATTMPRLILRGNVVPPGGIEHPALGLGIRLRPVALDLRRYPLVIHCHIDLRYLRTNSRFRSR
jgi:hypothetical protein